MASDVLWLPGILFVGGIVSPSDLASINIVCVSLCVCMFIYIHLCVLCINLCNCKIIWFLEVLPNYVDIICPCCVLLLTNEEEVVWRSLPVILFYWGEGSHLYPAIHHPLRPTFTLAMIPLYIHVFCGFLMLNIQSWGFGTTSYTWEWTCGIRFPGSCLLQSI